MTFVYVIVSSQEDFITEQALISMHSLRMYNNDAHITVVSDHDTLEWFTGNRGRIKEYIDTIISPEIPVGLKNLQKSRFLKTSLRKLIKGDFLYLDSDTVVCGDLSDINNIPFNIAISLNRHKKWNRQNPHPMVREYENTTGIDILNVENFTFCFNTGVIFSRDTDTAHRFFDKWHQIWLKDSLELGFHKDQVAGWRANYELGNIINELNPIYNCQFVFPVYALKYFDSAKILHYFNSTPLASCLQFKNKDYLKKISEHGVMEEDVKYIREIKSIYLEILNRITDKALRNYTLEETIFEIIKTKISKRFPLINNFIKLIINLNFIKNNNRIID